jgi:hypothetical protein
MSTTHDDPLYEVFEEHLHSGLYDEAPIENFIRDVVDFYWTSLNRQGHVPHRWHEHLRVDLVQDVHDMLKVKIYGHYGIGEYNRARGGAGRTKKSS